HPLCAPVLYTFQQAREDLTRYTEPLTTEQLWARPFGLGPAGFHILHLAGSVERLMSYLEQRQLTQAQIAAMQAEKEPPALTREELLAAMDRAFTNAEAVVRSLDPGRLTEPRTVGRKRLPTTAIGLLVHIAEHTQRH